VRFTSYLQAAKRDCRMFVGLKSMARRLERLKMIVSEVQHEVEHEANDECSNT